MFGKGLLKGLGITLKHGVEKPRTIQYPEQRPFLHQRFRGCLEFDYRNCIVCGMCIKACPNRVLSFETAPIEGSKKKRLLSYTIDLQYCLFCNLCVEACPTHTLFFVHNFELSTDRREQIKRVYTPPAGVQVPVAAAGAELIPPEALEPEVDAAAEAKRRKQIEAIKTALSKGGQKVLAKYVDTEEDAAILAELLQADEKKRDKVAALIVDDKEKARKAAQALVAKEKSRPAGGETQ
ncbi:MAG: 4Fe-4S binding protein [Syntrophomonadaceae bacterium]|nr:4Fe-4S binding protein [Syntrophomonadaceae bacterium]